MAQCGSELPIKQKRVVKYSWEDSFGCILEKLDQPEATITKIKISANEKFADPVHAVSPDAPIVLCEQFKCFYVCITMEKVRSRSLSVPSGERNAFDVWMASSHEIVLPSPLTLPEEKELCKDQQMYNDLIGKHLSIMHSLSV